MVEVLQNLLEVAAILDRMSKPEQFEPDDAAAGECLDDYAPIDGVTYI